MRTPITCLLAVVFAGSTPVFGQDVAQSRNVKKQSEPEKYDSSVPKPTLSEVKYGDHPRHVIDFWKAESSTPTPLVFVIHGGGWQGGSKERVNRFVDVRALLEAGISVVAINYRYVKQAEAEGIQPPVKAPLEDAAIVSSAELRQFDIAVVQTRQQQSSSAEHGAYQQSE